MKLRKGDMVKVITGKDKGKTGKIIEINTAKGSALVEKLNFVKRHQKPTQQHRQGGIIEKEAPIDISNLMYYDDKAGKATRIGYKITKDRKARYSKRSGEELK